MIRLGRFTFPRTLYFVSGNCRNSDCTVCTCGRMGVELVSVGCVMEPRKYSSTQDSPSRRSGVADRPSIFLVEIWKRALLKVLEHIRWHSSMATKPRESNMCCGYSCFRTVRDCSMAITMSLLSMSTVLCCIFPIFAVGRNSLIRSIHWLSRNSLCTMISVFFLICEMM